MATYTVLLRPDAVDGGYTVTVPALPGGFTLPRARRFRSASATPKR